VLSESVHAKAQRKYGGYVGAMLRSPTSLYSGLGAVATGALLSIPFGLGVGALPLLAYATGSAIAALFVPSSKGFRDKVDRARRAEERFAVRDRLAAEIKRRGAERGGSARAAYDRLLDRIRALEAMETGGLGEDDLERLADVSVNYLSLWLAKLVGEERASSTDAAELRYRLETVERRIEEADGTEERRTLERAREDLARLVRRREGLEAKLVALDAAMLALPDTVEEIYQQLVTRPNAPDAGAQLQQAVDRLRIEESLDLVVDEELADILRPDERLEALRAARRAAEAEAQGDDDDDDAPTPAARGGRDGAKADARERQKKGAQKKRAQEDRR
jgi:hypothetical protein